MNRLFEIAIIKFLKVKTALHKYLFFDSSAEICEEEALCVYDEFWRSKELMERIMAGTRPELIVSSDPPTNDDIIREQKLGSSDQPEKVAGDGLDLHWWERLAPAGH